MFQMKKRLIKIISLHTANRGTGAARFRPRLLHVGGRSEGYGLVDEVIKSRKEVKGLDGAHSSEQSERSGRKSEE